MSLPCRIAYRLATGLGSPTVRARSGATIEPPPDCARSTRLASGCSRTNQNIGRLTAAMIEAVFESAVVLHGGGRSVLAGDGVVHLTLAIADFMRILITAALWAAASAGGIVLLALAVLGGIVWGVRRMMSRRKA